MNENSKPYEKNKPYWLVVAVGIGAGLVPAILIYVFRASLWNWRLDGKQNLLWAMVLKAVAGYVAVIGAVITAFKYIDEKSRQRYQDRIADERQKELDRKDERKDFLQERQAVYRRLGLSLARIMNRDPGDNDWNESKEKFYEIYRGEIPFVADDQVMNLIEPFAIELHRVQTAPQKEKLRDLVYAITDACRKSLGDAWSDISKAGESPRI